jgi:hypothetical protein
VFHQLNTATKTDKLILDFRLNRRYGSGSDLFGVDRRHSINTMRPARPVSIVDEANRFGGSETTPAYQTNAQDRILDRLGDLLFVADDLLATEHFNAPGNEPIRWIGVELERIYSNVNEMMKKISN